MRTIRAWKHLSLLRVAPGPHDHSHVQIWSWSLANMTSINVNDHGTNRFPLLHQHRLEELARLSPNLLRNTLGVRGAKRLNLPTIVDLENRWTQAEEARTRAAWDPQEHQNRGIHVGHCGHHVLGSRSLAAEVREEVRGRQGLEDQKNPQDRRAAAASGGI